MMPTRVSGDAAWTTEEAVVIDLDGSTTIESGSVHPTKGFDWCYQTYSSASEWLAQPHSDDVIVFGASMTPRKTQRRPRHRRESPIGLFPMSDLGQRLLAIRERYLAEGGTLLTPEEIDADLSERRGGWDVTDDDPHIR